MRIEWSLKARQRSLEIVDYISVDNPDAARRMLLRIQQRISSLAHHPFTGRPGRKFGTRELVIPYSPFVVIYCVETDCIIVENVVHASQLYPPETP